MSDIGFIVIGAPKAGTTSLFEYMRRHPQIHMPAQKEISFFASDRAYQRGIDSYLSLILKGAPSGAVCGEATPRYMAGAPSNTVVDNSEYGTLPSASDYGAPLEEVIPRRIKQSFPDVKLICVLRDPVARAHSHYRMSVLNRVESRSFTEAIDQLIEPETLERTRLAHSYNDGYVVYGEYGRVIGGFLRVFPREQLMVIFSGELAQRPSETVAKVFEFIGVATDFVPENLNTRYLAGAAKQRLPGLNLYVWKTNFARIRPARALWRALPDRVHRGISHAYNVTAYRIQLWNARRDVVDNDDVPSSTRLKLINHFRPDSETLGDMLNMDIPWLDEWAR